MSQGLIMYPYLELVRNQQISKVVDNAFLISAF